MNMYPFGTGTTSIAGYTLPTMPQQTNNFLAPQIQPQQTEIPRVSGKESIMSFPMAPNSSIVFFSNDPNSDLGWIVTTDAAAYKTIAQCHITPDLDDQPVKTSDLKSILEGINTRLGQIEERMSANGQHASKPAWTNKSGNGGNQPNSKNDANVQ